MTTLADLTTIKVGGTPSSLTIAHSEAEIIAAVTEADDAGRDVLIIGGGSNIVVSDDFTGDVIKIASQGIENDASACAGAWVTVQAGHTWDDVVATAVANGWAGIEGLSGIPGTAGATVIQNVGAYGEQVSETVAQVRVWNRETREIETIFAANCAFGYRTSIFKQYPKRWVILAVVFQLPVGDMSKPISYDEVSADLNVDLGTRVKTDVYRQTVLKLRTSKGMVVSEDPDSWSVGSFFMNPRVMQVPEGAKAWPEPGGRFKVSAAWLIEHAGFGKGFGLNDRASLSTKHTLALTNRGTATSSDILELARHIRSGVQEHFGITLEPEAQLVGFTL